MSPIVRDATEARLAGILASRAAPAVSAQQEAILDAAPVCATGR
jgi:hypothetical protein